MLDSVSFQYKFDYMSHSFDNLEKFFCWSWFFKEAEIWNKIKKKVNMI